MEISKNIKKAKSKKSPKRIIKYIFSSEILLFAVFLFFGFFPFGYFNRNVNTNRTINDVQLFNPYQNVNWDSVGRYRANLHSHTTLSDGINSLVELVEKYEKLGFDFLAVTDHNRATYPWGNFGVENSGSQIQAIAGNELSHGHHVVSLFSDFQASRFRHPTVNRQLSAANRYSSGEARFFMAHPGRYVPFVWMLDSPLWLYNIDFYRNLFNRFDTLVGMEVFNQNDRYRNDRMIWDRVLSELMPHRPVWGIATDDNHGNHFGVNKVTMLLENSTKNNFRNALDNGEFFASSFGRFNPAVLDERHSKSGARWDYVPYVTKIYTCQINATITIEAQNYTDIIWISYRGREVGRGSTINYRKPVIYRFLRATIINEIDGELVAQTLTQPFGIK